MDNQKYFFYRTHWTNPANLLEEDILEKIKANFGNSIFTDKEEFFRLLDTQLFTCNFQHKRCRPLELTKLADSLSKDEIVHFRRQNASILLQGRFILIEKDFSDIQKTSSNEN